MKIYVDGSYKPSVNPNVAGWGFVAYNWNGEDILQHTSYGVVENPVSRQIDGELKATLEALKWVQSNKEKIFPTGGKVEIFHDYEGIGRWARNEWKTNTDLTKKYKESVNALMLDLSPEVEIAFSWIKGHSNNVGNDWADELASQAVLESVGESIKKKAPDKQQILVDKEEIEKILGLLKYPAIVPNVLTAKEHLLDLLKKFN